MEHMQERRGGEASMYSDSKFVSKIKELHTPENVTSNVRLLFPFVDDFIDRATQIIGDCSTDALLEGEIETLHALHDLQDGTNVPKIIGKLFSQVTSEILNGNDAHNITIWVLKYLRYFDWEEKVVLTLTAFALTFGDFWFLVRIYAANALTADQRELASSANKEAYRNQIEANNEFIKTLVSTTRYLLEIGELPLKNAAEVCDRFVIYVYWILRCAIVAATQIILLSSRGLDQYLEGIPIPPEFNKLTSIGEEQRTILFNYYKGIGEGEILKNYHSYQTDNIKLMRSIINPNQYLPPLYHGLTQRRDHLDVLRKKRVLLLISGLDIAPEDIANLKHDNTDSKRHEIVWIPVVRSSISGSDFVQVKLEILQNSMPWYSVYRPSMVTEAAIKLFETEWGFKSSPILVLLSHLGKVLNKNAIHMVRIWQNLPVDNLTSEVELQLWEKESWNLKFLANDIDPIIQECIRDEAYIFLYGGNDIEWIRKFTTQAKFMASTLQSRIEIVYVGTSLKKDRFSRVQEIIMTEQLGRCLPESSRAYFWSRINSMIYSKSKLKKLNDPYDNLLIRQILKFYTDTEEWVLLARGSRILINGSGRIALTTLLEIDQWKGNGIEPGFVNQFVSHCDDVHHCLKLYLPANEDVVDHILCPYCRRSMETYVYVV